MAVKKENAPKNRPDRQTGHHPDRFNIAIVGGGAAGLFAAYFAKLKHPGAEVLLLDKNSYLGAKVLISGGGRCNVTTGIKNVRELLKNYPRGAEFLRTAMENFTPEAVMTWFETQGIALKTEPDLRVFPVSNNGHDIVGALTSALLDLGVVFRLNNQVTDIDIDNPLFRLSLGDGSAILAERVILTTGGNAYRQTGSSGDGYSLAKKMGHTITPLAPSLTSLKTKEEWSHELSGISFQSTEIKMKKQKTATDNTSHLNDTEDFWIRKGPFLFTHQGLTGPTIFALSSLSAYQNFTEAPVSLSINLFPKETADQLLKKINETIATNSRKKIENLLALFVPHALASSLNNNFLHLDSNLQAGNLDKKSRQKMAEILQNIPLTIIGRGAGDEMVTAGGVSLDEVNPQTMESRLRRGLFFAGELLDIDGFTGGFNLQASWATGALAGDAV